MQDRIDRECCPSPDIRNHDEDSAARRKLAAHDARDNDGLRLRSHANRGPAVERVTTGANCTPLAGAMGDPAESHPDAAVTGAMAPDAANAASTAESLLPRTMVVTPGPTARYVLNCAG